MASGDAAQGVGAAAGGAGASAAAGDDGDAGLFQQILQRAGIDMPGAAPDATGGDADDDDGDAGLFRDILEAAGIDTGRPPAPPAVPRRRLEPTRHRPDRRAAPTSLQDVVSSLAASGGLGEVLNRMPQNELADLVLNLARPAAADDAPTGRAAGAADDASAGTVRHGATTTCWAWARPASTSRRPGSARPPSTMRPWGPRPPPTAGPPVTASTTTST